MASKYLDINGVRVILDIVDEKINDVKNGIPQVPQEWYGTKAEYDAIEEKDDNVTYYIYKD